MPYKKISDLPKPVKHVLPKNAQKIYLEAFNNAWKQYKDKENLEIIAHKVAWSTVKKQYEKIGGKWVKKDKIKI